MLRDNVQCVLVLQYCGDVGLEVSSEPVQMTLGVTVPKRVIELKIIRNEQHKTGT
jgi:hypothetical protein